MFAPEVLNFVPVKYIYNFSNFTLSVTLLPDLGEFMKLHFGTFARQFNVENLRTRS